MELPRLHHLPRHRAPGLRQPQPHRSARTTCSTAPGAGAAVACLPTILAQRDLVIENPALLHPTTPKGKPLTWRARSILDTETTGLQSAAAATTSHPKSGCVELVNRRGGNNLHLYLNPRRDSHEDALKGCSIQQRVPARQTALPRWWTTSSPRGRQTHHPQRGLRHGLS